MSAHPTQISCLVALSESELQAGAAWYAKYHQRIAATLVDDHSAAGTVQREHFRDLYIGLRKLGVRMRVPDGLANT